MSTNLSSPSRFLRGNNVIPFFPARRTDRRIKRLAAALALVSLGAACGMKADSLGSRGGTALQAAAAPGIPEAEFVYFPSQYVNQATGPSKHIQAF